MAIPRPPTSELGLAAATSGLSVAVGGVVGLAWWLIAPLPRLKVEPTGVFLALGEAETAVAADGWFALCAGVAGVACAVAVFGWVRAARPGALAGLTAGGLLGAVLAGWLGSALGPGPVRAAAAGLPVGTFLDGPLKMSAHGVVVLWPLLAVAVYFSLAAGLEVSHPARSDRSAPPWPP